MSLLINVRKRQRARATKLDQRRKFVASIRPTDVFLVTYPKSGTTWMAFLLANIIYSKQYTEQNIILNLRTLPEIVPDINELYSAGADLSKYAHLPNPRVFTVHARYDRAFPRVIYILRDPRSVMVSYWHHKRLVDPGFDLSLKDFIAKDDHWPTLWNKHVEEWLFRGHKNVMTVRYEEMDVNALEIARKVIEFIKLPSDERTIKHAVEAAKFDNMKTLEDKYGRRVQGAHEERFIRKGNTDSWREELDEESLRILEQKYGAVMTKLGY